MTRDELKSLLVDIQAVLDRIERPVDLDENCGATAGILVCKHGLSLVSDGLLMFAGSTGMEFTVAAELVAELKKWRGDDRMMISVEGSDRALSWIRRKAIDGLHLTTTGPKIEGVQ